MAAASAAGSRGGTSIPRSPQEFWRASDAGGHDRPPGGHRLHHRVAHPLGEGGKHDHVGACEKRSDGAACAEEADVDAKPRGLALEGLALFPVAGQQQSARPASGLQVADRLEQVPVALVGLEIGHAQQDRERASRCWRERCSAKAASGRPLYTTVIFCVGNPLLRASVLGHGLGVRDEQVSDPCREPLRCQVATAGPALK